MSLRNSRDNPGGVSCDAEQYSLFANPICKKNYSRDCIRQPTCKKIRRKIRAIRNACQHWERKSKSGDNTLVSWRQSCPKSIYRSNTKFFLRIKFFSVYIHNSMLDKNLNVKKYAKREISFTWLYDCFDRDISKTISTRIICLFLISSQIFGENLIS